jgi:hypothetical protein
VAVNQPYGGQRKQKNVVTLEGDKNWYEKIINKMPDNVHLHYVSEESREINIVQVKELLLAQKYTTFDVIIIDALYRDEIIPIALRLMAEDGIIICDNSDGLGIYEGFKDTTLSRVDFFGNVPGVVFPHCTSIFFKSASFIFSSKYPIPVLAIEN